MRLVQTVSRNRPAEPSASPIIFFIFGLLFSLAIPLTGCSAAGHTRAERSVPGGSNPSPPADADSDQDGFPDAVELKSYDDRANFRRWMTAIAENQFEEISEVWQKQQQDCAGLVRFSVREALRRHDRPWIKAIGGFTDPVAPDVRAWTLDRNPLGEKIFRTDYGSFTATDLAEGKFSEYADARTLKNFNTVFVGRNRRAAEPGDLLFFHQPWVQRFPYHVMVFLGEARYSGEGASDWVVYHTGASPDDDGAIKKVRLAVLDLHPNRRWRPLEDNPNFLGFYRLKFLDDGKRER